VSIVVDTSAIVAMLQDEPEAMAFATILSTVATVVSAGSLIETLRVVRLRRGEAGADHVWRLIEANRIEVVPVDQAQVRLAEDGMRRFGKGRRSAPAVLNFGDLFAYALARQLKLPLLFKGDDFGHTDLETA
jgi:ribonuclease VapC